MAEGILGWLRSFLPVELVGQHAYLSCRAQSRIERITGETFFRSKIFCTSQLDVKCQRRKTASPTIDYSLRPTKQVHPSNPQLSFRLHRNLNEFSRIPDTNASPFERASERPRECVSNSVMGHVHMKSALGGGRGLKKVDKRNKIRCFSCKWQGGSKIQ